MKNFTRPFLPMSAIAAALLVVSAPTFLPGQFATKKGEWAY
jgi:hypothetical protein